MRLRKATIEQLLVYLKRLYHNSEMPEQMGGNPRTSKESARLWRVTLASSKRAVQVEEEIKRRIQKSNKK